MANSLLRVLAWLAVPPYVLFVLLVVTGPATWSSVGYVAAFGLVLFGLATTPADRDAYADTETDADASASRRRRARRVVRIGAAGLVAVAGLRIVVAANGRRLHFTDRDGHSGRWIDRLVDESDLAVDATRVLVGSGMLRDDAADLPSTMRAAYDEMRRSEGDIPTPQVATLLGLERPDAFDVVRVEPPSVRSRGAVVFLHGSAGAFALPCWRLARMLAPVGLVTVCPSTGWSGVWATSDGEATLRRTLEGLRNGGHERIVLMGLSNGGIGASRLAARLQGSITGLVLFSGADPNAPVAGVPTLVFHGVHDTHVDPSNGEMYAMRTGATFVPLEAGHFAMLVREAEIAPRLVAFVSAQIGSD